MPTVVEDCPRCDANQMTFDVMADTFAFVEYDWKAHYELAIKCRRCNKFSVLHVSLRKNEGSKFRASGSVTAMTGDIEPVFLIDKFIDVSDLAGVAEAPAHLPPDIAAAFGEGAKCFAIGCYNASASMFRLCLDLATKPLLPDPALTDVPQPTKRERFNLGPRLDWLIAQGLVPAGLRELADCVREDANDGVHDGSLGSNDAADLQDFASALLERQFTEPKRLELAKIRRDGRRVKPAG